MCVCCVVYCVYVCVSAAPPFLTGISGLTFKRFFLRTSWDSAAVRGHWNEHIDLQLPSNCKSRICSPPLLDRPLASGTCCLSYYCYWINLFVGHSTHLLASHWPFRSEVIAQGFSPIDFLPQPTRPISSINNIHVNASPTIPATNQQIHRCTTDRPTMLICLSGHQMGCSWQHYPRFGRNWLKL